MSFKAWGQVSIVVMLLLAVIAAVVGTMKGAEEKFADKAVETEVKELRYERDIRDLEQRKFKAEEVFQGQPMPLESKRSYDKLKRELEEVVGKKKALYTK